MGRLGPTRSLSATARRNQSSQITNVTRRSVKSAGPKYRPKRVVIVNLITKAVGAITICRVRRGVETCSISGLYYGRKSEGTGNLIEFSRLKWHKSKKGKCRCVGSTFEWPAMRRYCNG